MSKNNTAENKISPLCDMPMPACVVNPEGKITIANESMKEVFAYKEIVDSNFFALTGVKREDFFAEDGTLSDEEISISRNDNYFVLEPAKNATADGDIVVYFINVTMREHLKERCNTESLCLMYISIDNYDEITQGSVYDSRITVPLEVDRCIHRWAEEYDAVIETTGEDTYFVSVYRKDMDRIIESKFSILDDVRKIDTRIEFPVSLSIGVGIGGETLKETTELAAASIELALGRGGDQAVVKNGDATDFYGGTLMSYEKNNKGKSRIIAHALKHLILESQNVIVMGHAWPDMDSFGASLAAHKICEYFERDVSILLDEYNEALQQIVKQAKDTEDYKFINKERAAQECDKGTLIIVVDTNRPTMTEYPELLDKAGHVVIIDHHRLSEESLENATLSYVESYASSASELMVEIMQYSAQKRLANKFEAEAMLAGMVVDTNSFSIKTGVRTFEAAAWLRRAGADTTEVKRFFQAEATNFQTKAEAIANAEYMENGIVLSITEGYSPDIQIINSQVADQLLMVKGVKAAFVVGKNDRQKTVVSARSLGEVNVQLIMEKFGGGGHLNSAGAQLEQSPEEFIAELKVLLPDYLEDNKNTEE